MRDISRNLEAKTVIKVGLFVGFQEWISSATADGEVYDMSRSILLLLTGVKVTHLSR